MRVSIGGGRAEWAVEAVDVSYLAVGLVVLLRGMMASILFFALRTPEERGSRAMTATLTAKNWCDAA